MKLRSSTANYNLRNSVTMPLLYDHEQQRNMKSKLSPRHGIPANPFNHITTVSSEIESIIVKLDDSKKAKYMSREKRAKINFVTIGRNWASSYGYSQDEAEKLLSSILELRRIDNLTSDDGIVVSPVKKKQKSNDHSTISRPSRAKKIQKQQQQPQSLTEKYSHIKYHGLSEDELQRIEQLKKGEIIPELKQFGGEFHQSWKKQDLVEALIHTYAAFNMPSTQPIGVSTTSNGKSDNIGTLKKSKNEKIVAQNGIKYSDVMIVSTKQMPLTTNDLGTSTKSDISAREQLFPAASAQQHVDGTNKRDDNMKKVALGIEMDCDNDNDAMSVASSIVPELRKEVDSNVATTIQRVGSDDSDMTPEFFTAEQFAYSQSQSQRNKEVKVPLTNVSKSYKMPASDMKQPRVSPTVVPEGIVNTAIKLYLSSQKKEAPTIKHPIPTGRILYPDTASNEKETEAVNDKSVLETKQTVPELCCGGARGLSKPLFTSNGITHGMAHGMPKTFTASMEARQANVAKMKAKSQQTFQQKVASMKTGMTHSGTLYKTAMLKPYDRVMPHTKLYEDLSTPMDSKPAAVRNPNFLAKIEPTHVFSNPRQAHVLPKPQEFLSYEMTDEEYDSEDEEEEEDRRMQEQKQIPEWARSSNLQKALEIQFRDDYPLDPDELFGEVHTCNLEAIFGKGLSKYRKKRNSSGDWTKDRVTTAEKKRYKQIMRNKKH